MTFTEGVQSTGKVEGVESVNDVSYKSAVVPVYINYNVNDNFNVWTEASFDAGSDDEVETENQYSVGARYTF